MRAHTALSLLGALLLAIGCQGSAPIQLQTPIPSAEATFLLDPLESFQGSLSSIQRIRLQNIRQAYRRGVPLRELRLLTTELTRDYPDFPPALVSLGQVSLLEDDFQLSLELARKALNVSPDDRAALFLAARSAEKLGMAIEAVEYFSQVSGEVAAAKVAELKEHAVALAFQSLLVQVDQKNRVGAEKFSQFLIAWAPGSLEQLRGELAIAELDGDPKLELKLLRLLVSRDQNFQGRKRLAELEFEIGDMKSSVALWERHVQEFPEDQMARRYLQRAKFRWQLERLPAPSRKVLAKGMLNRGDLAALLFWLVPEIRLTPVRNPPIASDIIDHPEQQAILKVIGLGVLGIDETLHRFRPDLVVNRRTAVSVLLDLLQRENASCLQTERAALGTPGQPLSICSRALGCQFFEDNQDCRLDEPISGDEFAAMIERYLELAGRPGP